MRFPTYQLAMAASLAALVVAAPIAFRVLDKPLPPSREAETRKTDGDRKAATEAKDGRIDRLAPPAGGPAGEPRKPEDKRLAEAEKAKSAASVALKNEAAPAPTAGLESTARPAPSSPPAMPLATDRWDDRSAAQAFGAAGLAAQGHVAPSVMGREIGIPAIAALDVGEHDRLPPASGEEYRDRFESVSPNPVKQVAEEPVSTFSIDVDTSSYAFVRRALNEGRLPPKAAVRAEEMINYFDYDYPRAASPEEPFKPTITVTPSPWNTSNRLVHIGIKGYELAPTERPRANIVLLIDVSGSMAPADRLPLVKSGLRMLIDELKPEDSVGIVTYASGSGIALTPTKVVEKSKILAAIDGLGAGGSTAGAQGIEDAYRLIEETYDKGAVNRVILATDGDFNVGMTNDEDLKGLIERKREKGIFLSILGVGRGNYNDRLMQTLAQNGNGVAAYADTLNEARKVLAEQASKTLFPIAKDVKIQVEWNPDRVTEYRLIGYETRNLRREDFNNDKVDAGDVGSGHTVTAIYEITRKGAAGRLVDDLRYAKAGEARPQAQSANEATAASGELGYLKLRYKLPKSDTSVPMGVAITDGMAVASLDAASSEVRFSVAVTAFAELLRGSPHVGAFDYEAVRALAQSARGEDAYGSRAEFLSLVRLAKSAQP